jgi:hypothetical protein
MSALLASVIAARCFAAARAPSAVGMTSTADAT